MPKSEEIYFVTSWGFKDLHKYDCNFSLMDNLLDSNHVEADSRIHTSFLLKMLYITSFDTDVLVKLCYLLHI